MKQPIQLNDFLNFKSISQLKSNPSQTCAIFVVSTPNEKDNTMNQTFHLLEGQTIKQLTFQNKESQFQWLNDDTILFNTKRLATDEEPHSTTLYALNIKGGEAQPLYQIPIPVSQFEVVSQSELLLTSSISLSHPDFYKYSKEKRETLDKEKKQNENYVELHEIPFWFNGTQYIDQQRQRLFTFNTISKELRPLTKPSQSVSNLTLSQDKKTAYLVLTSYKHKRPLTDRLYQMDLVDYKIQEIKLEMTLSIFQICPLKSGLYLLASDGKTLGLNQNPCLYRLDHQQLKKLSSEIHLGNSVGSDVRYGSNQQVLVEDDSILMVTTHDGHARVEEFSVTKGLHVLFEQENVTIDGLARLKKKLFGVALVDQQLQEIYEISKTMKPVSHLNDTLDDKNVITPEKILFESNGAQLSGWILLPEAIGQQKKVPAILDIHGGPKTVYGSVYYHEMQVWANLGYAVIFCNPHGSDGKGDEFSDIRGKYGTIDYQDIMNFVDVVLEKYPMLDAQNMGVTGGSYGGFMTNWIIGHTQRFKVAATQRSITNWTSFYGVSDIGYYFADDQNAADLYSEKGQQKLWNHSPLKYAKNFKTPTLIIHSTDDYRCPIDQGYQLFTALKDRKIDSKMVIFKGENHDLSRSGRPQSRIKRLSEITQWMNKYLKK